MKTYAKGIWADSKYPARLRRMNNDPSSDDGETGEDELPPEITPIRKDPTIPRLIAIGLTLAGLPAAVFVLFKVFHG